MDMIQVIMIMAMVLLMVMITVIVAMIIHMVATTMVILLIIAIIMIPVQEKAHLVVVTEVEEQVAAVADHLVAELSCNQIKKAIKMAEQERNLFLSMKVNVPLLI